MTSPRRFEQDLPALLADLYLAGTPDYRDDLVRQLAGVRQRPAWAFPGRWLPMDLVTARVPSTRAPMRALGVLALIAILLAAALAVYIGSQQTHLPAPFGLAANGVIAYVTPTGAIGVADPATGEADVLVSDQQQARAPAFSLDGTQVAYERMDADGTKLMVVDLERRTPIQVALIPAATDSLQWSPDASTLALISDGQVWIANTDGSGARALDLGFQAQDEIEWRPPGGKELVVRGVRDGKAGLFLVGLDDARPRPITPMTTGRFDYLWLTWAPDGSRLAYSKAEPEEVHILDVDRGTDTLVHGDAGLGMMFPRWSPDGGRLAVMTWLSRAPVKVRIGVLSVSHPSPHVTLTGPTFGKGIQHEWAPDGSAILAAEWGSSQPWLLDPAGGPARQPNWTAAFPDWVEWQRLAP